MTGWRTLLLLALGVLMAAPGCRKREVDLSARYSDSEEFKAEANLLPKGAAEVSGTINMRELVTPYSVRSGISQVMTYVKVEGLNPGTYTVRLHDKADCSAPAETGDTGHNARSFQVGADGVGTLAARLTRITIQPEVEASVLGKAIVVHAGNADRGLPVACGLIEKTVEVADAAHGGGHDDEAHGDEGHGDKAHGDKAHDDGHKDDGGH